MTIVHYNRIKEVIEAKGLKQSWVAEQLGYTPRYFYKITNNHVQPSVDKLYELAQILDVKVSDLLCDEDFVANQTQQID